MNLVNDAFHPDLRRVAAVLPRGVFNRYTLPLMRGVTRMQARKRSQDIEVISLPGGPSIRLHQPFAQERGAGALLWIHGGGYVIGSAAQDDRLCRRLAQRLNVPVAAVDYRLAPRHPYPAALEDCYAALMWFARYPGVDAERIAIGGASAGGGLTAALALTARDRGELAPLFQLLAYPMVDDRSCDRPGARSRLHRMWNPECNRLGWTAYLGDADPDVAVPSRRTDLSGVAPAWIGVGTLDPLYEEDLEYARRLEGCGVSCQVHVVPGAFHGFDAVAPSAQVSRTFFDQQCYALRDAFSA